MRFALMTLLLTACSMNLGDAPNPGQTPALTCRGDIPQSFVGQSATQDVGARMMAATGARNLRWVAHDMMVTMEFRPDRLTVYLDAANRVERASCG